MHRFISLLYLALMPYIAFAATPQTGLWSIDEENNGEPGRGFQVEVQNGVIVLTFYGYEQNGASKFYLMVGTNGKTANGALEYYEGGMYFGSPNKSAHIAGSAGNVIVAFTSATTGTITLPGEPTKAISKTTWTPPDPDGLLGEWVLVFDILSTPFAERMKLTYKSGSTDNGNGIVSDISHGYPKYLCERHTKGSYAGNVFCGEYSSTGTPLWAYLWDYSVDSGSGTTISLSTSTIYEARVWRSEWADGSETMKPTSLTGPAANKSAYIAGQNDIPIKTMEENRLGIKTMGEGDMMSDQRYLAQKMLNAMRNNLISAK